MGRHAADDPGKGAACFIRGCYKDGIAASIAVGPELVFRLILCDPHRLALESFQRRLARAAAGLPPVPAQVLVPVAPPAPRAPRVAPLLPIDACVVCDTPFAPAELEALGRRRRTCSPNCRMRLSRARDGQPDGRLVANLRALAAQRSTHIDGLAATVRTQRRELDRLERQVAPVAALQAERDAYRSAGLVLEEEVRRLTAKLVATPEPDRDAAWLRAELERTRRSGESLERENRVMRHRLGLSPYQRARQSDTTGAFQLGDRRSSSSKCRAPCPKRGHEHACRETRGHLLDHEWWSARARCVWPVVVAIAS